MLSIGCQFIKVYFNFYVFKNKSNLFFMAAPLQCCHVQGFLALSFLCLVGCRGVVQLRGLVLGSPQLVPLRLRFLFIYFQFFLFRFTVAGLQMGDLSRLKGTQSNTLCSGFGSKNPLMVFLILFSTGTNAVIGTKCVVSENIMKSTHKKRFGKSVLFIISFLVV